MPISAALNQTNFEHSLPIQNACQLPNDLDKIVGKTNLLAIYIVSKIKAFFSVIFYGKINSWNGFCKNVNETFVEISKDKKIKLYQKYKKSQNTDYTIRVGYKTTSQKEATALRESNGILSEFKKHEIQFTNEEMQKIKSFLEKIPSKDTENTSNILIDLNKFLSSEEISKEVKDLIDRKLNQLPEYRLLKKKLEEKKLEKIKRERNNFLKTAAIITAITAILFTSLVVYQYLRIVPVSKPPISEILRNQPSISWPQSWRDIKIFGRISKEEIDKVFWKIGRFLFKDPYEIAEKSIFNIL